MKKILLVFGTRPEAIKMCPLVQELKKYPEFQTVTAITGQHREMLSPILECFHVVPDYNLEIMKPGQNLFDITERILKSIREIYQKEKPDLVLVHGDTTTTFSSALAAYYMRIPIGHVEAGLRTYNKQSPDPEEFNRQAVGSMADFHFAPTKTAVRHLLEEHKPRERIYLTGNTAIDALKTTIRENYSHPILKWAAGSRLVLLTSHRRENLGERQLQIFRGIRNTLEQHENVKLVYPVHRNPVVQKTAAEVFGDCPNVMLCEPLDVIDFHNIMARCEMVLTDSGGIQEEAPALGKPVLVLRDTTERPEGVESGNLRLAGTDKETVEQNFTELLDNKKLYHTMQHSVNPYGDGNASRRIAEAIKERTDSREKNKDGE